MCRLEKRPKSYDDGYQTIVGRNSVKRRMYSVRRRREEEQEGEEEKVEEEERRTRKRRRRRRWRK